MSGILGLTLKNGEAITLTNEAGEKSIVHFKKRTINQFKLYIKAPDNIRISRVQDADEVHKLLEKKEDAID